MDLRREAQANIMTTTKASPDLTVHRPTHTTVAMVLVREGKVLLKRQSKDAAAYANMWDLPRTDAMDGVSPEDALLTGLAADLGINVTSFSLLSAADDLVEGACWRRFVYRVTAFEGDLESKDVTARWYSEKEFADVFQINPLVLTVPIFAD